MPAVQVQGIYTDEEPFTRLVNSNSPRTSRSSLSSRASLPAIFWNIADPAVTL